MTKSLERNPMFNYRRVDELTPKSLISGEYPNPFRKSETKLLLALMDGDDTDEKQLAKLGIKIGTLKALKAEIRDKVLERYHGQGNDYLTKALCLSVLGGWIDDSVYENVEVELTPLERQVLIPSCFGNTPLQIARELHFKQSFVDEVFLGIKQNLNFTGDYQVKAWGASKLKRWFGQNPHMLDQIMPL